VAKSVLRSNIWPKFGCPTFMGFKNCKYVLFIEKDRMLKYLSKKVVRLLRNIKMIISEQSDIFSTKEHLKFSVLFL